jgi:hypothetical protein
MPHHGLPLVLCRSFVSFFDHIEVFSCFCLAQQADITVRSLTICELLAFLYCGENGAENEIAAGWRRPMKEVLLLDRLTSVGYYRSIDILYPSPFSSYWRFLKV